MKMTTVHAMTTVAPQTSWSGIDAGRREQVDTVFTGFRHFRRSRRTVKPAAVAPRPARSRRVTPWPSPLELKGSNAYLRELRRIEMEAWQQSGGDFYRPMPGTPAMSPTADSAAVGLAVRQPNSIS